MKYSLFILLALIQDKVAELAQYSGSLCVGCYMCIFMFSNGFGQQSNASFPPCPHRLCLILKLGRSCAKPVYHASTESTTYVQDQNQDAIG